MGDWLPTLPWHLYTLDHSRIYPKTRSLMFPYFLPSMLFSSKAFVSPRNYFRYDEFPGSALLKHHTNMYTAGVAPPHSTARIVRQLPEGKGIVWSLPSAPSISVPSVRGFRSSKMPRPYGWRTSLQETGKLGDVVSLSGKRMQPRGREVLPT